ncbi:MAG: transglycosylase SLT domain-containing protein [Gammaproteobacteria bacterium]|nr:transglycosylase SLT domain-containing protein [Gammaproteobacteria bacterium]MCW8988161.1 transglycosylase SLT domain-containing protein [Gammaproteobacteria bacterium]MCW9032293.1 transglycosylase SLT domain-containing protein [Gammaproteobacteria bacterium]
MNLSRGLSGNRLVNIITGSILLLGNLAVAEAFTLKNIPEQVESNSSAPLKKNEQLDQQRKLFIEAEAALKLGRYTKYRKIEHRLNDYPLYPYLRFIEIDRNLKSTSSQAIQRFLATYHDTPLANKLYSRWINSLAREGKSEALVQYFRPTQNTRLLCHYANALHQSGKKGTAFSLMGELWQTGSSLPKSCDPILDKWSKAGYMTSSRLWARIHLVMNKGKRRLATYIGKSLPKEEQFWLSLWKKIQRNPEYVLKADQHFKDEHSPIMHWILVDGMTRLARRKPLVAAEYWQEIRHKYHFNAEEKERIERRLSLSLARAATPLSRETLKTLKLDSRSSDVITPHILSAISDKDWEGALAWLNSLKSDEKNSERWLYWRARAVEEMGRLDEARSLYLQITDNRSYYSFLAADRIGDRYQLTHRSIDAPAAELMKLQHIPAVARAGELYQLNRVVEARREWHFAIQSMDKKQLLIAAQLANKWGWHDRSIITLALAQHWDDLELRFPLAHKQQIGEQAKNEQINPAWAFAVIRQESAFTTDARSSAGALGLMQLMPRTARQVARSLQIKRPKQRDLLESNINIKLGVRYLRKLKEKFNGSPILATAAYNAGPWRVKGWLPKEEAQSADLWIENVPFTETRKYLKRVLTYTIIYEQRLGLESTPLLERMMPISTPDKKI